MQFISKVVFNKFYKKYVTRNSTKGCYKSALIKCQKNSNDVKSLQKPYYSHF